MLKLFNGRGLLARAMRALAFAAMLGVVSVPAAEASQNATSLPNTGTLTGLTMVNTLNGAMDTIISQFSGASAPASPTQYQLWADTTNSLLKIYVSSTWLTIGSFSGGKWVAYSGSVQETAPTSTGSANAYVLTYSPAPATLVTGQTYTFITNFSNTGAATLNINSLGAKSITKNGTTALASGDLASGQAVSVVYDGTQFQLTSPISNIVAGSTPVPVRQTVLSGPVDSNGLPSFGGSTGSTTVTASGTLIATAANGFAVTGQIDKVCSITNPSWAGLSTNGTMYLYLDASGTTCTVGSSTQQPAYQFGGSYSTTNDKFTFNIQAMSGQVGNGSTSAQSNRVYVGEVTVASGVVSAITWYALMGRYTSAFIATLPGNSVVATFNHNIGTNEIYGSMYIEAENTTTDAGWAVGDRVKITGGASSTANISTNWGWSRLTLTWPAGNIGAPWSTFPKGGGAPVGMTLADWKYRAVVNRGW